MTSRFRHEVHLGAAVEQVFGVLVDPELHAARYTAAGATGCEMLTRDTDADGTLVLVSRRAESGGLPTPVARLVRGAARITQTERWAPADAHGIRRATWSVVTAGVPVDIAGTFALQPRDGGSQLVRTGAVTAHLRLIGGAVEKVAVEQSGAKLVREERWLVEHLDRAAPHRG